MESKWSQIGLPTPMQAVTQITSNCKINGHFSTQNHHVQGQFSIHSSFSIERIGKRWHLYCNPQYDEQQMRCKENIEHPKLLDTEPTVLRIQIIIFNAKFIIFDAKFIILNAKFIKCNTKISSILVQIATFGVIGDREHHGVFHR